MVPNICYFHPYSGKMIQFDEPHFSHGWLNQHLENIDPKKKTSPSGWFRTPAFSHQLILRYMLKSHGFTLGFICFIHPRPVLGQGEFWTTNQPWPSQSRPLEELAQQLSESRNSTLHEVEFVGSRGFLIGTVTNKHCHGMLYLKKPPDFFVDIKLVGWFFYIN